MSKQTFYLSEILQRKLVYKNSKLDISVSNLELKINFIKKLWSAIQAINSKKEVKTKTKFKMEIKCMEDKFRAKCV